MDIKSTASVTPCLLAAWAATMMQESGEQPSKKQFGTGDVLFCGDCSSLVFRRVWGMFYHTSKSSGIRVEVNQTVAN